MLRTTLQAIEHDEDALVSLPGSHTLAQIVRKADKSFKRQLSRCPDIRACSVSPLRRAARRVRLDPAPFALRIRARQSGRNIFWRHPRRGSEGDRHRIIGRRTNGTRKKGRTPIRFSLVLFVLFVLLAKIPLVLCPAADCRLSRVKLLLLFGTVCVASLV